MNVCLLGRGFGSWKMRREFGKVFCERVNFRTKFLLKLRRNLGHHNFGML
jgi:hypothetical protein